VQRPGPGRVPGRVHSGQGLPQELSRPRVVAGQMCRPGGPFEQVDPVQPGQLGRPRHLRPQLQGTLELSLGLGEGVAALGLVAGLDRGRQGPPGVAGGVPVVGQLGGHGRTGAAGPLRVGRDGRGHLAVEAGPFTREQVGVGDLAEQGVAELVVVVTGPGRQQLGGDRLPERLVEPPLVVTGNGGEQPVRRPPADHRGHPERLPGRLRDLLDPAPQQIRGGGWQLSGPGGHGRQQLLGEERVALGAGEHAVDHVGRRLAADNRGHLRGRLRPVEPCDLHAPGPGTAELGQERPEPGAAGLVAAVGDQHHDPLVAQVAGQVGEQVPGRAVGPVDVLHHQHERGLLGQGGQQAEHELEQPDLVGDLGRPVAGGGASWPPRAGSSRASSGQDGPARVRTGSTPSCATRSLSASTAGAKGRPPPPTGTRPPTSTRVPFPTCRAATSVTGRVLPTPASPPTSSIAAAPPPACSSAPSRASSSRARPTKAGLVTCPPISPGLSLPSHLMGTRVPQAPGER
jgi:hypothetical protein